MYIGTISAYLLPVFFACAYAAHSSNIQPQQVSQGRLRTSAQMATSPQRRRLSQSLSPQRTIARTNTPTFRRPITNSRMPNTNSQSLSRGVVRAPSPGRSQLLASIARNPQLPLNVRMQVLNLQAGNGRGSVSLKASAPQQIRRSFQRAPHDPTKNVNRQSLLDIITRIRNALNLPHPVAGTGSNSPSLSTGLGHSTGALTGHMNDVTNSGHFRHFGEVGGSGNVQNAGQSSQRGMWNLQGLSQRSSNTISDHGNHFVDNNNGLNNRAHDQNTKNFFGGHNLDAHSSLSGVQSDINSAGPSRVIGSSSGSLNTLDRPGTHQGNLDVQLKLNTPLGGSKTVSLSKGGPNTAPDVTSGQGAGMAPGTGPGGSDALKILGMKTITLPNGQKKMAVTIMSSHTGGRPVVVEALGTIVLSQERMLDGSTRFIVKADPTPAADVEPAEVEYEAEEFTTTTTTTPAATTASASLNSAHAQGVSRTGVNGNVITLTPSNNGQLVINGKPIDLGQGKGVNPSSQLVIIGANASTMQDLFPNQGQVHQGQTHQGQTHQGQTHQDQTQTQGLTQTQGQIQTQGQTQTLGQGQISVTAHDPLASQGQGQGVTLVPQSTPGQLGAEIVPGKKIVIIRSNSGTTAPNTIAGNAPVVAAAAAIATTAPVTLAAQHAAVTAPTTIATEAP